MNQQVKINSGKGQGHAPLRLQSLSERTESTLFQRRRQHALESHDIVPHGEGIGDHGNVQGLPSFPVAPGVPGYIPGQGLVSCNIITLLCTQRVALNYLKCPSVCPFPLGRYMPVVIEK